MTNIYDYGERVTIYQNFYDQAGTPATQSTATITITDSAGTEQVSAASMTLAGTGAYTYTYVIPSDGPAGSWIYTTVGTDASGYETTNSGSFEVSSLDLAYTTPGNVRELLPDLLMAEDDCGVIASGTSITLTNAAFGVPTILKNTTTLYDSVNYSFTKPRAITLSSAASGENYTARVYIAFSDQQLLRFISRADRIIDDFFFGVSTEPSSAYKDDWSSQLTAAFVLRIKSKGDTDMLAWADVLESKVMNAMLQYKTLTGATIFDDAKVTRDDATSVDAFCLDQQTVKNYETDD